MAGNGTKFNISKDMSKRTYKGIVYDSEMEMRFFKEYVEPKLVVGEIISCKRQIPYCLLPSYKRKDFSGKIVTIKEIKYVADYVLVWPNGSEQVIDVKGCPDTTALLKRKLFWAKYPDIDYIWMSYSKIDGGWVNYDYLKAQRAARKKAKLALLKEKNK